MKEVKDKYLGQERIEKIKEITLTDYEDVDGTVSIEDVDCIIDDLIYKIEYLQKKLSEKNEELIEIKEQYCEHYSYQ